MTTFSTFLAVKSAHIHIHALGQTLGIAARNPVTITVGRDYSFQNRKSGHFVGPQSNSVTIFISVKRQLSLCFLFNSSPVFTTGDCGSTVAKVLCYDSEVAGSIPAGVSGFFIDIKSF